MSRKKSIRINKNHLDKTLKKTTTLDTRRRHHKVSKQMCCQLAIAILPN